MPILKFWYGMVISNFHIHQCSFQITAVNDEGTPSSSIWRTFLGWELPNFPIASTGLHSSHFRNPNSMETYMIITQFFPNRNSIGIAWNSLISVRSIWHYARFSRLFPAGFLASPRLSALCSSLMSARIMDVRSFSVATFTSQAKLWEAQF